MAHEFRKFDCRICGKQIFVHIPVAANGDTLEDNVVELTCPSGHTDTYDLVREAFTTSKSVEHVRTRAAVANIG